MPETLAQVFPCEIFKNNYFEEHLRPAASVFPRAYFFLQGP